MDCQACCATDNLRWAHRGTLAATILLTSLVARPVAADESPAWVPREHRTSAFRLWTDLPPDEAQAYLRRMHGTLDRTSRFFGRPMRGQVDCYLVADLDRWPAASLPNAQARFVLQHIGGCTLVDRRANASGPVARPVKIFATTDPGVVEHEVVHAYCQQVYGRGGPDWFREGMAQALSMESSCPMNLSAEDDSVQVALLRRLRDSRDISVNQIVTQSSFIRPLTESIESLGRPASSDADANEAETEVNLATAWASKDEAKLATAHKAYAESWALCRLLMDNPNYEGRFRLLSRQILESDHARFEDLFRPVQPHIEFELRQAIANIESGFSPELCYWDWSASTPMAVGQTVEVKLLARRGFQSSHVKLEKGATYTFHAIGRWKTDPARAAVDADGDLSGCGRLEGVIFNRFALSEPLLLGQKAQITPSEDGVLHLRCHEDWDQLADNSGRLTVRMRRAN